MLTNVNILDRLDVDLFSVQKDEEIYSFILMWISVVKNKEVNYLIISIGIPNAIMAGEG